MEESERFDDRGFLVAFSSDIKWDIKRHFLVNGIVSREKKGGREEEDRRKEEEEDTPDKLVQSEDKFSNRISLENMHRGRGKCRTATI